MRRHISLYFGSVGIKVCFNFIIGFFTYFISFEENNKKRLFKRIKQNFQDNIGVYAFTSARGATAAFLKAVNSDGKETILSSYTCLAVPTAIVAANSIPIYCDTKINSLNINNDIIFNKINSKTKVVIAQHTLGEIVNIDDLKNRLNDKKIYILEDCALSIGSKINEVFLGSQGDAAIYSLELSKSISVGWGGILVVNNQKLKIIIDDFYSKVPYENLYTSIRNAIQTIISGISYNPVFYNFLGKYIIYFGYKYKFFKVSTPSVELKGNVEKNFIRKLPSLQMWMAEYQWKRLEEVSNKSIKNQNIIASHLSKLGYKNFSFKKGNKNVTPRISFLVSSPRKIIKYFENNGIEIGRWFDGPLSPIPKSKKFKFNKVEFPNSTFLSKYIVNLPCHVRLSKRDIYVILNTLTEFSKKEPESMIVPEQQNKILI